MRLSEKPAVGIKGPAVSGVAVWCLDVDALGCVLGDSFLRYALEECEDGDACLNGVGGRHNI